MLCICRNHTSLRFRGRAHRLIAIDRHRPAHAAGQGRELDEVLVRHLTLKVTPAPSLNIEHVVYAGGGLVNPFCQYRKDSRESDAIASSSSSVQGTAIDSGKTGRNGKNGKGRQRKFIQPKKEMCDSGTAGAPNIVTCFYDQSCPIPKPESISYVHDPGMHRAIQDRRHACEGVESANASTVFEYRLKENGDRQVEPSPEDGGSIDEPDPESSSSPYFALKMPWGDGQIWIETMYSVQAVTCGRTGTSTVNISSSAPRYMDELNKEDRPYVLTEESIGYVSAR